MMKRLFPIAAVLAVGAIALTLRTTSAAPAAAIDLDDPTIVAIFDVANTADIETGELAMKKGTTKEVRDFGAMLARDHKAVRQLGRVCPAPSSTQIDPTPTAAVTRGRPRTS